MNSISIKEQKDLLSHLKGILSIEPVSKYLYDNSIGILIILDHIKAKEWPWKGKELKNEPTINLPFFWGFCYAENNGDIKIIYDIHPSKCLPLSYNACNSNAKLFKMPIAKNARGTLAGCARSFVTVNKRIYNINEKIPLYCSIFGIPDDCYCNNFEEKMIISLQKFENLNLWCFEQTDYLLEKIQPKFELNYMKGRFLPSKFFPFVDSSSKFLRGLYKAKELIVLNSEPWYSHAFQLLDNMNPFKSDEYYQYEEKAQYYLKKKLVFEFIRQFFLIINQNEFREVKSSSPPELDPKIESTYLKDLKKIKNKIVDNVKVELNKVINKYKHLFNYEKFKTSRFLVLDVEYIHINYPISKRDHEFNFPCLFSNIIWKGVKKGFDIKINIFNPPCNFCTEYCDSFKLKKLKFDCLEYGKNFYHEQLNLLDELFANYENLKLYSYGKSDILQIEQLSNFYTDSFEKKEFRRKNRIKTRRLIIFNNIL